MTNRNDYVRDAMRCVLIAWSLCLATATGLQAQEVSAGITGIVTDPSGAAIVGAEVTALDTDRGVSWNTQSNEAGNYAFPRLRPGRYSLSVTAEGFRRWSQPERLLEVNQRARIDITMQLGAVTEVIEVTAAGAALQTEKTELGAVITGSQTVDLPLISRNFIVMTTLVPGVTTTHPDSLNDSRRSSGGGRPYVNGNREQANNFLLDGIDNNQVSDNLTSYQPNIDAIAEFNVITNNASAEFGNFQGGIISVTLKAGSNEFHGSAFEYFQNDKLAANSWQNNWQDNERAQYTQHIYGFTFGGPVVPNRLFFFMDYQGTHRSTPGSEGRVNVIPSAFRQGDFSRLLTERDTQLFDFADTDATGRRRPFPGNVIPLSRIDPVASALFANTSLYPAPVNDGLRFNQTNTRNSKLLNNQGDIKLDWNPSDADYVSARYSKGVQDSPSENSFPLHFDGFSNSPFQAGVVNWTRSISPTVSNEVRLGVNNVMIHNGGADKGLGNVAEELGITNGNDRGPGLMSLQFSGGLASGIGSGNLGTQTMFANTTYQYVNNLTVIRGRHQMKMGGQALRQHMNTFYAGNTGRTGFIRFNGNFTRDPMDTGSRGFAEADFFLGTPVRLGRGVAGNIWGHRKWILGFYFQDDWRVSDELTLNLGLRWEWHQPLYEVLDRQSNFEPYSGRLLLAGQDGNSRALYNSFNRDIQPRVGFAWTPKALGSNTVFRSAFTISSFMEGTGTNLRLPINPPFNVEFEAIYDDALVPVSRTGDGFSTVVQANPFNRANIRLWDQYVQPSHVQQWNFTIEHLLPHDTVLSVGYVGQKGTHLVVPMPYFQRVGLDGQPAECNCSPYLSGNPELSVISQISGTESNGNQEYNALQASLKRRMRRFLQYQVSYTWSKGMSDAIGYYGSGGLTRSQSPYWQNLRDQRSEWGPTFFDQAQSLVANFVYLLPVGKERALGTNWGPAAEALLGGWQLSGIVSFKSGFPWTIRAPDRSGTGSRGFRANRVGDGAGLQQVGPGTTWFDRAAYTDVPSGTFGNAGNGTVRGPGYSTLDASLEKNFRVTESQRVQFRAEFINLFNSPIFDGGNTFVTSATFGEITRAQGARRIQFGFRYEF